VPKDGRATVRGRAAGVRSTKAGSQREIKILLCDERALPGPSAEEGLPAKRLVERGDPHELQVDDVADERLEAGIDEGFSARLESCAAGVAAGCSGQRLQNDFGDARISTGAPGEDAHDGRGGKVGTNLNARRCECGAEKSPELQTTIAVGGSARVPD
jgi:hypothetical protein